MPPWQEFVIEYENADINKIKKSLNENGFITSEIENRYDSKIFKVWKNGKNPRYIGICSVDENSISFGEKWWSLPFELLIPWIEKTFPEGTIIRFICEVTLISTGVISKGKIVWLSTYFEFEEFEKYRKALNR